MQNRNQSLDALRGYAILTMILSGSIAFGDVLPAWMYHAQVPPPHHQFIPAIAGITWVDLVFPFFLFSMGAAIPLSLQKKVIAKSNFLQILFIAGRRFLLLAFFALFTHHMMAWAMAEKPAAENYLLSIAAFTLVFFQLYDNKNKKYNQLFFILKVLAFAIAVALLYFLPFKDGKGFTLTNSDIIIIVLANMAFFGTLIWWCTKNNPWIRIGTLPFIMAVFLAAKETDGGWAKALYNFNGVGGFKIDWLYKFYFLKYLFIIIPGTLAGDWLFQFAKNNTIQQPSVSSTNIKAISLLAFAMVVTNTIFLFGRHLLLNIAVTAAVIIAIYFLIKEMGKENNPLLAKFFKAGVYLLLLGLFFEAYEGGIKKDTSTYSYYFVTSGLAFFMLIGFNGLALRSCLKIELKNPYVEKWIK